MNLLLSLRIGPPIPQSYQNNRVDFIKQEVQDLVVYDCDNHSDSILIRYATDLLEKSTKTVIIIEMEQENKETFPLGQLRLLFTKFIQYTTKIQVFTTGNHYMISNMLQALPATIKFHNLDSQKQVQQVLSFLEKINEH